MPHTHIEKVSAMQIFYIYDLYQSLEMETRFVEDNVNATSNPNQLSSNEACASLNFEPARSDFSMYSSPVANHGGLAMY